MKKLGTWVIVTVSLIFAFWLIVVPFVLMYAWNFLVNFFNQPQLTINFWVAFWVVIIAGIIKAFFIKDEKR